MHGVIEVYSKGEKILESENLTVDNASKNIADFMSLCPDIEDISAASSLLDASNYTIQAISFGKGLDAFICNAHDTNVIAQVSSLFGGLPIEIATSSYSGSSNVALDNNPQPPNPLDTLLASSVGYDYSFSSLAASEMGQNLNVLNYAVELGIGFIPASLLGCYAYRSGGATSLNLYNVDTSTMDASTSVVSNFNATSSMDYLGFCRLVSGVDPDQGLVVSGESPLSSTSEVVYGVTVSAGDVASIDLYGGLKVMGLWTFDLPLCLAEGNPPFEYDPVDLKRFYKLHSKKVFTQNLTGIVDAASPGLTSYDDLLIIWRLKFN